MITYSNNIADIDVAISKAENKLKQSDNIAVAVLQRQYQRTKKRLELQCKINYLNSLDDELR